MLQASPQTIHFKRILNFDERQPKVDTPGVLARDRAESDYSDEIILPLVVNALRQGRDSPIVSPGIHRRESTAEKS
jgi:hypothetical protein